MDLARRAEIDLAIVTACGDMPAEVVREEPLLWATSAAHRVEEEEVLPLALSKPPCVWRTAGIEALVERRPARIASFTPAATRPRFPPPSSPASP